MPPNFEDYWPWYVTAWVLYALSGMLMAWALFWDRARRRGVIRYRCPKCWYDLRGVKNDLTSDACCPECGRRPRNDKDLLRTRRHSRMVLVSMLIFLFAYCSSNVPRMREHGQVNTIGALTAFLPTSLLILAPLPERDLLLFLDENDGAAWHELQDRREKDGTHLWDWQNQILGWRVRRHLQRSTRYGIHNEERAVFERLISTTYLGPYSFPDSETFSETFSNAAGTPLVIYGDQYEEEPWVNQRALQGITNAWSALEVCLRGPKFISPRPWQWTIQDDHILITLYNEFKQYNRTVIYDTTDLVSSYDETWHFEDLVMEAIEPDHWTNWGGDMGDLGVIADHLVVRSSVRNQLAIENLLALLRSEKSEYSQSAPIYMSNQIEKRDYFVPLKIRMYEIGDLAASREEMEPIFSLIYELLDPSSWLVMGGEVGWIEAHRTNLLVRTTSDIHEHIEQLMRLLREDNAPPITPLRPVDPSDEALPQDFQIRVYPVNQLLQHSQAASVLKGHILSTFAFEHWQETGGDLGQIHLYSDKLIILTSFSNHEIITHILKVLEVKINSGLDLEQAITELEKEAAGKRDSYKGTIPFFLPHPIPVRLA